MLSVPLPHIDATPFLSNNHNYNKHSKTSEKKRENTKRKKRSMSASHENVGASTLSLHADNPVNVVNDVAPPLHVATTFRYSDNPDELVPVADAENVRLSLKSMYK